MLKVLREASEQDIKTLPMLSTIVKTTRRESKLRFNRIIITSDADLDG